MSILKTFKNRLHAAAEIEVSFPIKEPELSLKFRAISFPELVAIETAILRKRREEDGDLGLLIDRCDLFVPKLRAALVGWEAKDKESEFSEENKKLFFDGLNFIEKIDLVTAYTTAWEESKKEGNEQGQ